VTPDPVLGTAEDTAARQPRRVLVLGANGPSGRRTVQQALDRGLGVEALTRRPQTFPIRHERLHVVGGDATDPATVDAAVASCDAVISVIGTAFTWHPVEVYSATARLVVAAMERHGQRRLLAVTSAGVRPADAHEGGVVQGLVFSIVRRTISRTVYDDMEQMEAIVSASSLDWTIVRPPGLTDEPGTGYAVAENRIDGPYCARDDLAAMLLDHLDDDRFVRRIAAVTTPGLRVSAVQTIRRELLKR
jgi:putative NADH-flavin reductase